MGDAEIRALAKDKEHDPSWENDGGVEKAHLTNREGGIRSFYADDGTWTLLDRTASEPWRLDLRVQTDDGDGSYVFGDDLIERKSESIDQIWINTDGGIEHIIIVKDEDLQDETGTVIVPLVAAGLAPVVLQEGQLGFRDDTDVKVTYSGLFAFDADHRQLTTWFEVGRDNTAAIHVDAAGARWPLTIDPLAQTSSAFLGSTTPADFGFSIAAGDVTGDGDPDLIVGVPGFDGGSADSGAVFVRSGFGGVLTTTVFEGQGEAGSAVAFGDVDGNGKNDLVMLQPRAGTTGTSNDGSLRIFLANNSGVLSSTPLNSFMVTGVNGCLPGAESMGLVVADFNDDGAADIAVRCFAPNSRLFVYNGIVGAGPDGLKDLNETIAPVSGGFASMAAIDVNQDGLPDLALAGGGRVRLIKSNDNGLDVTDFEDVLPAGADVTLIVAAGDVDGDTRDDLLISEPFFGSGRGRVRLYLNDGLGGIDDTVVAFSQTGAVGTTNGVGSAIGIGDVNKDRHGDLVICSSREDAVVGGSTVTDAGTCRVLGGSPAGINTATVRLTLTGVVASELRGNLPGSIAFADFFGDGANDLAQASSRWNTTTANGRGRVDTFDGDPANIKLTNEINPDTNLANARGGRAIATGDLNGDGFDDVAVGAPSYATNLGAVLVYFGGPGADNVADWCTKGTQTGEEFGSSLAIAKVHGPSNAASLVVGSSQYVVSSALGSAGRVRTYNGNLSASCNLAGTAIPASQTFNGSLESGQFGTSLANAKDALNTLGDGVVIGGRGKAPVSPGQVTVLPSNGAGLTTTNALTFSSNDPLIACDGFGSHVANAGRVDGTNSRHDILVGADICSSGGLAGNGKAFLLRSQTSGPALAVSGWMFAGVGANDQLSVVAGVGDVDNDGVDDFAVGAPLEDNFGFTPTVVDAGRVRVFRGSASTTPLSSAMVSMSTSFAGRCGSAIAGGDFNYDGVSDIIIGEPSFEDNLNNEGRVRVFFGGQGTIDSVPEFTLEGELLDASFGSAVAVGDIKGDAYKDIVVGAPGASLGLANEGQVTVRSGAW